jgi:hypothetical protein
MTGDAVEDTDYVRFMFEQYMQLEVIATNALSLLLECLSMDPCIL